MSCQKKIIEKIINKKADYAIGLERVHIKTASKIIASMITERKTTSSLS